MASVARSRQAPPDRRKAPVGADPQGDHVLADGIAQPNAGIETLLDDIGETVVYTQFYPDLRMLIQECFSCGRKTVARASSVQVMRTVPAGLSRSSLKASTWASISSKRGPMDRIRRSPASVGATLRVVRDNSLSPRRASRALTLWLKADGVTPTLDAALEKLFSRATARKATISLKSVIGIREIYSQVHSVSNA